MGRKVTRRQFLRETGAAAAVLAAGCGDDTSPPVPVGDNVVAIVHRDEIEDAVQTAVRMTGGLDDIEPGQVVFVKPNVVHPYVSAPAITTNPDVLAAVVRLVKARGATVIVGDRSARQYDTESALMGSGLRRAALDAGADEVYAAPRPSEDPSAWVLTQVPQFEEIWGTPGGILAMRKIVEADHFINVPTCKNHRYAGVSLSLKANIGSVGDDSRDYIHYGVGMPEDVGRAIAILNQLFEPRLNIVDAWDVLVNGGPEGVYPDAVRYPARTIIAGRDRVAVDVTGISLIKLARSRVNVPDPDEAQPHLDRSPWLLPQIVHAIERGLGIATADEAELAFDGFADQAELDGIFRG